MYLGYLTVVRWRWPSQRLTNGDVRALVNHHVARPDMHPGRHARRQETLQGNAARPGERAASRSFENEAVYDNDGQETRRAPSVALG
jgi:hypothetical protein